MSRLARSVKALSICFLFSLFFVAKPSFALVPVDLELSLLIDVSVSVSTSEFNLQKQGYVNAFKNSSIQQSIDNGSIGSIAANVVYWSGSTEQQQAVNWTLVTKDTAVDFANLIDQSTRPYYGGTSIGPAVNYAVPLFQTNNFQGTRLVIDVSGDGTSVINDTVAARDAAEQAGITINGIAIGTTNIETFYQNYVITSDGFTEYASSFQDFENAITAKLAREIQTGQSNDGDGTIIDLPSEGGTHSVPEPATVMMLSCGLASLVAFRRQHKK